MTRQPDNPLRIDQIGRDLLGWTVGVGLLRLHLALFALGATGLVFLNLYRAPAESWSVGVLQLWAIVLACHAAGMLAGWSTWKAVRPHRLPKSSTAVGSTASLAATAPYRPTWPLNGAPTNGHAATTGTASASNGHAPVTAPLTLPVRGRFTPPASQPPIVRHSWHPPVAPEAGAKLRASASDAMTAGRTGWQRLTRVTRTGLASMTARLSTAERDGGAPLSPPSVSSGSLPPAAVSPPGWPVPSPPLAVVPPGWESVVSPPELPSSTPTLDAASPSAAVEEFPGWAPPSATPPARDGRDEASSPIPPAADATATPRSDGIPVDAAADPPLPTDTEWTWMEAAAAAWLARREVDETGENAGDDATAPPPGQP